MKFTYQPFLNNLHNKGITFNGIKNLGLVPDHSLRKLSKDESVGIEHVVSLCEYFNVGIAEIVTLMPEAD